VTTATHPASRTCYQRGCRAEGCWRLAYRYRKQLSLEHSRGQRRLRDAHQTRTHIQRLLFAGWTQAQIATASGLSTTSIHNLHAGTQAQVANWRAAAILAINIGPPPPDEKHVDATGSMRRLRALCVIGHTLVSLAPQLGTTRDRLKVIANSGTRLVRTQEAAAISRLYRRLATVPGTSKQVQTLARNRGWHGPLAWDDIDDPNAVPEIDKRCKSGRRRGETPELGRIVRLTAEGLTTEQIAARFGVHPRTITRVRSRAIAQLAAA